VVSYSSGKQLQYLPQQSFGPLQNLRTSFVRRLSEDPETKNRAFLQLHLIKAKTVNHIFLGMTGQNVNSSEFHRLTYQMPSSYTIFKRLER
jgi:hypothetical protein